MSQRQPVNLVRLVGCSAVLLLLAKAGHYAWLGKNDDAVGCVIGAFVVALVIEALT